jgi:hypothetical protein
MIDIEAIINRHLTSDKMDNKTFYEGHIVIDLHNAIEEIKELRAALVTMQGAYELGVDTERAAVLAWLRDEATQYRGERSDVDALQVMFQCGAGMTLINAADAIERGEHLKES